MLGLRNSPEARDARAIFQRGVFRPQEWWVDGTGVQFNPGNYYYVGGNTKLYGAVLLRYRARDFHPIAYREGTTPGWPFNYDELEPWYTRAEKLYSVHGALGFDESEPPHSSPSRSPPFPTSRRSRGCAKNQGSWAAPIPIAARRRHRPMAQAREDTMGHLSDTGTGKMDAESCGLAEALRHPNVELRENVKVERVVLDSDGQRLAGVEASVGGERKRILGRIVILAAGAVNSAALLLASRDEGIANRSDAVGRYFMNHNCSAVLAIDPRIVNHSVYQKTLGITTSTLATGKVDPHSAISSCWGV